MNFLLQGIQENVQKRKEIFGIPLLQLKSVLICLQTRKGKVFQRQGAFLDLTLRGKRDRSIEGREKQSGQRPCQVSDSNTMKAIEPLISSDAQTWASTSRKLIFCPFSLYALCKRWACVEKDVLLPSQLPIFLQLLPAMFMEHQCFNHPILQMGK